MHCSIRVQHLPRGMSKRQRYHTRRIDQAINASIYQSINQPTNTDPSTNQPTHQSINQSIMHCGFTGYSRRSLHPRTPSSSPGRPPGTRMTPSSNIMRQACISGLQHGMHFWLATWHVTLAGNMACNSGLQHGMQLVTYMQMCMPL